MRNHTAIFGEYSEENSKKENLESPLQKSLKTVEECMVFFADVGLMRRETPLVCGGGLITDIIGTACSLYRRSTSYVRLPTTLIGLIDASVAIKVNVEQSEWTSLKDDSSHVLAFRTFSRRNTKTRGTMNCKFLVFSRRDNDSSIF